MTLRVSGKNLDIGEALRTHVHARVGDAMARFFEGGFAGHVTVQKEGGAFRTDCLIHLPTGLTLQTESMAHDPHASVDLAAERLAKRLKRHKQRIRDHHQGAGDLDAPGGLDAVEHVIEMPGDEAEADGFAPVVIAESTKRMKSLSVSEAVGDLDLSGAGVLVFRHAGHGRVNVVYRRPDGHIGWIDLPTASADVV
ncbi:ribosome hibernation-promoting factor, HPF/YfiA family [Labrys wisconsinensis]|uniref:Ribosome hibernation promoting factor n=1 Tax=Labrys wisconsinensis TaxID=425677 RepID=A0ABU0IZL2_9HYPH|nr:ribosome-associated translation inhibitor RaiA [Labrys wisconsinensis]MDQ0467455.1 ribosomal subunit interface protein [Labrys wisconsinensis]